MNNINTDGNYGRTREQDPQASEVLYIEWPAAPCTVNKLPDNA